VEARLVDKSAVSSLFGTKTKHFKEKVGKEDFQENIIRPRTL